MWVAEDQVVNRESHLHCNTVSSITIIYTPLIAASICREFPFSMILPLLWVLGLWEGCNNNIRKPIHHRPIKSQVTKIQRKIVNVSTLSVESPEFPFKSLWFSSFVQPSLVYGSNVPPLERSGNSTWNRNNVRGEVANNGYQKNN